MTDTQTTSKNPSHITYHVKDGNSGKGYWTRIGASWAHADGNGIVPERQKHAPRSGA